MEKEQFLVRSKSALSTGSGPDRPTATSSPRRSGRRGRPRARYCLPALGVPVHNANLAQKLYLEHDEEFYIGQNATSSVVRGMTMYVFEVTVLYARGEGHLLVGAAEILLSAAQSLPRGSR